MNGKIFDYLKAKFGLVSTDITTQRTSAYVDMAESGRVAAACVANDVPDGQKVTVELFQAQDASGTGSKTMGVTAEDTAVGTEDLVVIAEAVADALDHANGFTHVGAKVVSTAAGSPAAAVAAAVTLVLGENRYKP